MKLKQDILYTEDWKQLETTAASAPVKGKHFGIFMPWDGTTHRCLSSGKYSSTTQSKWICHSLQAVTLLLDTHLKGRLSEVHIGIWTRRCIELLISFSVIVSWRWNTHRMHTMESCAVVNRNKLNILIFTISLTKHISLSVKKRPEWAIIYCLCKLKYIHIHIQQYTKNVYKITYTH